RQDRLPARRTVRTRGAASAGDDATGAGGARPVRRRPARSRARPGDGRSVREVAIEPGVTRDPLIRWQAFRPCWLGEAGYWVAAGVGGEDLGEVMVERLFPESAGDGGREESFDRSSLPHSPTGPASRRRRPAYAR